MCLFNVWLRHSILNSFVSVVVAAQKRHDEVEDEDQEANQDKQALEEEVAGVVSVPSEVITASVSSGGAQTPNKREQPEEK